MSRSKTSLVRSPGAADDWTIAQDRRRYAPAEHALWDTLFDRRAKMLPGRANPTFLEGLDVLRLSKSRIRDFDELSERLQALTDCRVIAVQGLIPDEDLFRHLANRAFVAGRLIRTPEQIDYVQAYGEGGLRSLSLNAILRLARLYWYTVDCGLMLEDGDRRLYGAGIVSSYGESKFTLDDPSPNQIRLDLKRVMRTPYRTDDYHQTCFVIDLFNDLLRQTLETVFAPLYSQLERTSDLGTDTVFETDAVLHRGSQAFALAQAHA